MQQESVDSKKVIRPDGSFMEWFLTPNVQFGLLAILTVLGLFLPFTMLLSILILPPLMVAFTDRKFRPPLRMPKDCEMFDDTLTTETQAEWHCCKVSDEAAFCLIQRPYISKTLLTRRISPRGSP
ncbi:hypothetical protein [Klebsiella pneumoniae]|uniref:hypothetical protein n=1 Tax=Klebsiella pneumoniae TaxID=573 RepID=UPI0022A7D84A|nr:hypothetical protein [Klebsiella pneumoniae]